MPPSGLILGLTQAGNPHTKGLIKMIRNKQQVSISNLPGRHRTRKIMCVTCLRSAFGSIALTSLFFGIALASETDQFFERSQPLTDSTVVFNQKINETLEEIIVSNGKKHDQQAIVDELYRRLGGPFLEDKIERWAINSPLVDKRMVSRGDSIYAGLPFWSTRAIMIVGIGTTVRINEQLIGTDKISHFISLGRKFYRRYLRTGSEEAAIRRSLFTERAIFGSGSTGSFSNADLVANYEGYLFLRSLFDADVVADKPSILRWETDGWVMQRKFDWADHVNEYWDEALNVNEYDSLMYQHMRKKMVNLCPQYWENPSSYTIENEEKLAERYAHLQLHNSQHMRLDSLCPAQALRESESLIAAAEISTAR